MTPYTEDRCIDDPKRKTWWFISDYALGFISGWGTHPMDIALWGGGELLRGTVEVQGRATFRNTEGVCDTATVWEVNFNFSSRVTMKFVGVPNGQNQRKPTGDAWLQQDEWKTRYRRIDSHGTAFEGSEGWVHVDRTGINLQPEDLIDENPENFKASLVHSPGHVRNFLDCVKSRAETVCPVEAAVAVDTLCHLADAATRLGRKLKFDFKTERFVNDGPANQMLASRPMRKPWHL
jgi:predicted dehydrogenase